MLKPAAVSRRGFLKVATRVAAVSVPTMLVACDDTPDADRKLEFLTLDDALVEAEKLALAAVSQRGPVWTLAQTCIHCAQSIEYSLTGFPVSKSELFQRTAGAAAFSVFVWRGRMSHNLAEEIPGAPDLDPGIDLDAAMQRLRKSINSFARAETALKPHFAYGLLAKPEYEQAHAMHLANHFSAFSR